MARKAERWNCDVLVVGSGPGGATTSCLLAEAGRDVLVVEEGRHLSLDSAPSYSLDEMNQKYRNGGLTTTFGSTNVTYIEGRCVGGASEINAALYHRPLPETLEEWRRDYRISSFSPESLEAHFEASERELSVSRRPQGVGEASDRLRAGADALGWNSTEIERCWKYEKQDASTWTDRRQSMSETLIPRMLAAGGRLEAQTKVQRIVFEKGKARYVLATQTGPDGEEIDVRIEFETLFVCCGAVHTPLLLRRSGLKRNVGDSLQLHPMVRIAVRFDESVSDPSVGVPVHQVEEFKPHLTLGCSHTSLAHVALWLAGDIDDKRALLERWDHMAVYYALCTSTARGKVRNLPVFNEPLVRYPLTSEDMKLLGEGLYRLGELAFASGAREIFNPVEGGPTLSRPSDLEPFRSGVPHGKVNVTSIHLFSSCPMGEDQSRCVVDSYGRHHAVSNLYINDASMLPACPGVNPQATIMAIVRRNTENFLRQL